MKKLTTGKIFALCMGNFARGMINGIITTYLLTFFIPTNANTTLPQFFLNAAVVIAIIRGIGTVVDAITDPWVANLTDNCKSKLGRRIPFMRWSAIPYHGSGPVPRHQALCPHPASHPADAHPGSAPGSVVPASGFEDS